MLEYFDYTTGFEGGFDRPLVVTEKNKIVRGRNKQNQLKMDLNISNRNKQRYQLIVFDTKKLMTIHSRILKKLAKFYQKIKQLMILIFGKDIQLLSLISNKKSNNRKSEQITSIYFEL